MYYSKRKNSPKLGLGQITLQTNQPDPRRPFPPFGTQTPYSIAWPYGYPWIYGNPNLGPESYYGAFQYPYAQSQPYIPRWSGAFIQPGNIDPLVKYSGGTAPEDPTGGEFWDWGSLGPGESIAVASQWAGDIKPRGFATTTL